jgi:hypothetical protein
MSTSSLTAKYLHHDYSFKERLLGSRTQRSRGVFSGSVLIEWALFGYCNLIHCVPKFQWDLQHGLLFCSSKFVGIRCIWNCAWKARSPSISHMLASHLLSFKQFFSKILGEDWMRSSGLDETGLRVQG